MVENNFLVHKRKNVALPKLRECKKLQMKHDPSSNSSSPPPPINNDNSLNELFEIGVTDDSQIFLQPP